LLLAESELIDPALFNKFIFCTPPAVGEIYLCAKCQA